jgi:hypothetical protein
VRHPTDRLLARVQAKVFFVALPVNDAGPRKVEKCRAQVIHAGQCVDASVIGYSGATLMPLVVALPRTGNSPFNKGESFDHVARRLRFLVQPVLGILRAQRGRRGVVARLTGHMGHEPQRWPA